MHRSPRPLRALAATSTLVLLATTACSEPETSGGQFCATLSESMPVLAGKVDSQLDIDTLVETYTTLDGRTPLAIEESWHQLTVLVQTAATVAPDDPASVQAMADAAYASERSAREVATWVQATCGFSMPAMEGLEGPVTTPPAVPTTAPRPTPATDPPATGPAGTDGSSDTEGTGDEVATSDPPTSG
jgi:hypothetical protein